MTDILVKALEEQDSLCHHGILGQKWGVRRYQNPDGSLTDEGRKRYSEQIQTSIDNATKAQIKYHKNRARYIEAQRRVKDDLQKMQSSYDDGYDRGDKNMINQADKIHDKYVSTLMSAYDKDPQYSQYYRNDDGSINKKQREAFALDNIDESFTSDPEYYINTILKESNRSLVEQYNKSKDARDKARKEAIIKVVSDPKNKKLIDEYRDSDKKAWDADSLLERYYLNFEDETSIRQAYKDIKSGKKMDVNDPDYYGPWEYDAFFNASPKEQKQIIKAFDTINKCDSIRNKKLDELSSRVYGSTDENSHLSLMKLIDMISDND